MPSSATNSTAINPISSVLAQATSTTAAAIPIPLRCRVIEITGTTVKHFLAVGSADSAPALSGSNAGILQVGATVAISPRRSDLSHPYLYVASTTGTGSVDITFYA
jgi:hypothetical protein